MTDSHLSEERKLRVLMILFSSTNHDRFGTDIGKYSLLLSLYPGLTPGKTPLPWPDPQKASAAGKDR